jgi:uncharacterized protein (DUF1697 family)
MTTYIALLRGINVGGNNKIKMSELRESLERDGFQTVRSYIQSGNLLFDTAESSTQTFARAIEALIKKHFGMNIRTVVVSADSWQEIIRNAPKQWGVDPARKHNLLVLIEPFIMQEIVSAVGTLKPDIEMMVAGEGVLYQSMSKELYGKTTTGKLASSPVYKNMTVRNHNTCIKLADLSAETNIAK